MLLGIDAILIGLVCSAVPFCTYAIMKDYNREKLEKEEKRMKEAIELTKLKSEEIKLKNQEASNSNEVTNVKGMF